MILLTPRICSDAQLTFLIRRAGITAGSPGDVIYGPGWWEGQLHAEVVRPDFVPLVPFRGTWSIPFTKVFPSLSQFIGIDTY